MKALITAKIKLLFSPLLLLLLITVFVFTSCENSIRNNITADEENKTEHVITSKNPESGSIKININNLKSSQKNGRTVLPDIDTDNIVSLSLSGSQGTSTKNFGSWTSVTALTSETIELKKGDWNLTLTAQLDNGASFIATSPVTVTGTETQTVNFSLSTTATKGGVYLKVSYTGNVQVARYQLYKYTGTTSSTTPLENGNLTVNTSAGNVVFERPATGTTALAQGNYRILINFYGDADGTIFLNSYSEIIRIKGGFTSKADDRTIDLNSMYSITYMNGGTTPTPISGTPVSGSLVENYSARSSTIALPEMERSGYDFAGWFSNSACTGTPETEFSITSSTSLGNKTFYAKWTRVCAITYYIAAEGFTSESECIELTEDQCDEWGLSQSHTAGSATQLPLSPVVNENSIPITLAGYTLSSLSGTALTSNGSYYLIPASVSTDTSIYLHVKSHLSYIDPVKGDDKNLAFNPSTPAQTIAGAKKWLKNADSSKNPVLYVKSAISNKNDIENLSDLSSPAASGGLYGAAIVKRHSSFTNGSLLSITENLTLKNVTLDGGAIWSKTQTEIEADPELLVTRTNSGLSSSIYLISTGNATFEGVTIQNVDNTATTNNGNGAAVYINSGTLTLTNCHIKDCRSIRGALFATTAGKINAKNTRFLCNNSIGSGSDKGHGGAVYLYGGTTSGGQAIFDACSFQYNAANAFGGAVYVGNNAKATFKNQGSNSLANNFSDMATAAASRTCKGDFVYTRGTLTLLLY